jgi:hypothetical protein
MGCSARPGPAGQSGRQLEWSHASAGQPGRTEDENPKMGCSAASIALVAESMRINESMSQCRVNESCESMSQCQGDDRSKMGCSAGGAAVVCVVCVWPGRAERSRREAGPPAPAAARPARRSAGATCEEHGLQRRRRSRRLSASRNGRRNRHQALSQSERERERRLSRRRNGGRRRDGRRHGARPPGA